MQLPALFQGNFQNIKNFFFVAYLFIKLIFLETREGNDGGSDSEPSEDNLDPKELIDIFPYRSDLNLKIESPSKKEGNSHSNLLTPQIIQERNYLKLSRDMKSTNAKFYQSQKIEDLPKSTVNNWKQMDYLKLSTNYPKAFSMPNDILHKRSISYHANVHIKAIKPNHLLKSIRRKGRLQIEDLKSKAKKKPNSFKFLKLEKNKNSTGI